MALQNLKIEQNFVQHGRVVTGIIHLQNQFVWKRSQGVQMTSFQGSKWKCDLVWLVRLTKLVNVSTKFTCCDTMNRSQCKYSFMSKEDVKLLRFSSTKTKASKF